MPAPIIRPVHPRVGGEHASVRLESPQSTGSSPRGRGTPTGTREIEQSRRFIPAWAGNTPTPRPMPAAAPVHPRVGGEHGLNAAVSGIRDGSSPRGRGTLTFSLHCALRQRFIPAWAGNTAPQEAPTSPQAVHPRVGGEHIHSYSPV